MEFDVQQLRLGGAPGPLQVLENDEITRKLAMLMEGECEGRGPKKAAEKFGFTQQRYFQLRATFREQGAAALASKKRGPKTNYRCTDELVRQVIRHRFLDPDASSEVIAQKLAQSGLQVSDRSVRRIVEQYGLQKKTL